MAWIPPVKVGAIASAIQVVGGGPTYDPTDTASLPTTNNLAAWWNSNAANLTVSGTDVLSINDVSGNARNIATSGNPQLISNAYGSGSIDAIELNTSNHDFTTISLSDSWSVFMVAERGSTAISLINSSTFHGFKVGESTTGGISGAIEMDYRTDGTPNPVRGQLIEPSGLVIYEFHIDTGNASMFMNGTEVSYLTSQTTTGSASINRMAGTGSFSNNETRMVDYLIYTSVLNSTDRSSLRTSLASYYGITL